MHPERWLVLTVPFESDAEAAELSAALIALGARAVEETPAGLTTHLPAPADPEEAIGGICRFLDERVARSDLQVDWHIQEHEDWEALWKVGLLPRRVSDRIVVKPTWCEYQPEAGDVVVQVDPGIAFGTAEHATTRGCLRMLDGRLAVGSRIADVGAGSGILAIAAALLGARGAVAFESDAFACATARENVVTNGVSASVQIREGVVTARTLERDGPFDGVVANIEWVFLRPLLRSLVATGPDVPPGEQPDWVILGGILEEQREDVLESAARVGLVLDEEDLEDGWWCGGFIPADPTPAP